MDITYFGPDSSFQDTILSTAGLAISLQNSTTFLITGPNVSVKIQGVNLTYDVLTGGLNGGTVSGIIFSEDSAVVARFSSFSWAGADVGQAMAAYSFGDSSLFNNLLTAEPINFTALATSGGYIQDSSISFQNTITALGSNSSDTLFGGSLADTLIGRKGNDALSGNAGNDDIRGGKGNDDLFGGKGNDTLKGEGGNDLLVGGNGADTMFGNANNDTLRGQGGNDGMDGGGGDDVMFGQRGADSMVGGTGNDTMIGGAGKDIMNGGAGDDLMNGGAGDDVLAGLAGADTLNGGGGQDVLGGKAGTDTVTGGAGADFFIFTEVTDSYLGTGADKITDFEIGTDRILLSELATSITFVTSGPFSGTGAEVTVKDDGVDSAVYVDVDGDGTRDMRIDVLGVTGLTVDDFVLGL
ncbi:MAG: Ca2+-binding RTX toxin-like protein [Paracoccaceae bacterium]|jgi:Ca2+-binding RTX toxin-like protein